MRQTVLAIALCAPVSLCFGQTPSTTASTHTGWFGDAACTRQRVQAGNVEPNNPICARKCVKEGSPLGFIDEQAKTFTVVSNPDRVFEDIGYRVEISAKPSEGKLEVLSVKHLATINPMCGRNPLKKQ